MPSNVNYVGTTRDENGITHRVWGFVPIDRWADMPHQICDSCPVVKALREDGDTRVVTCIVCIAEGGL